MKTKFCKSFTVLLVIAHRACPGCVFWRRKTAAGAGSCSRICGTNWAAPPIFWTKLWRLEPSRSPFQKTPRCLEQWEPTATIGYDVDIANMVAKDMGVKVELVPVSSQNRIPYLTSGKVIWSFPVWGSSQSALGDQLLQCLRSLLLGSLRLR